MEIPPTFPPAGRAMEALRLPAIFLIVTAAISVLAAVVGLLTPGVSEGQLTRMLEDPDAPDWLKELAQAMSAPEAGYASNIVSILIGGFIILGAVKMMRLQSYGMGMAASILSVIPCVSPCCCFGIPFGIWSLVVLNRPEVKSAFAGRATRPEGQF